MTYTHDYLRIAAGYTRALRRAMYDGQIRRIDPEHLAWCLMGISDFLGMRWVLWEDEAPDIDALTDAALALLRDGIARPKPRRVVRTRTRTRTRTRGVTS